MNIFSEVRTLQNHRKTLTSNPEVRTLQNHRKTQTSNPEVRTLQNHRKNPDFQPRGQNFTKSQKNLDFVDYPGRRPQAPACFKYFLVVHLLQHGSDLHITFYAQILGSYHSCLLSGCLVLDDLKGSPPREPSPPPVEHPEPPQRCQRSPHTIWRLKRNLPSNRCCPSGEVGYKPNTHGWVLGCQMMLPNNPEN